MYLCNKEIFNGVDIMDIFLEEIVSINDDLMLEIMDVVKKILKEN